VVKIEFTIGSLFSGIGGIELGFEMAGGFTTKWFVEKDLYAQAILRKHWPSAVIYDDITKLDFSSVPRVDILTGGFPCQDISNAGKRAGITGSRSSLWKYYLKAISTLRPRYCLIENVSALLNRGLTTVLCDLAEVGYDAEWHSISASSVGAPHRRDRIFILAYPELCGCIHRQAQEQSTEGRLNALSEFKSSSKDVSNSYWEGQSGEGQTEMGFKEYSCADVSDSESVRLQLSRNEGRLGTESEVVVGEGSESSSAIKDFCDNQRRESEYAAEGWWAVEPELGRVAHGVPNRVDRIKCLGNAVVPQCADVFAKAIKEYEQSRAFGEVTK
jgi:DNA (cytosine-5)-methyltransferase 1